MKYFMLFVFYFSFQLLPAQIIIDSDSYRRKLHKIEITAELPDGLLQGKAVAIHAYPGASLLYKEKAEEIQPGFSKAGIDVVSHYLFEDIFSNIESIKAYKEQLKNREIDFIVYYIDESEKVLLIFPFEDSFFPQNAFSIAHANQEDLLDDLYLKTARSGQNLLNLLILKSPEFPSYPELIKERRAEFYDLNMKSGKLAIPKTEDSVMNRAIDSIMAAFYPYQYGLVEPGMTEDELRKEGYWFEMFAVHGTGSTVKNLLEYPVLEDETAFASVVADGRETTVKTIPIDKAVYKFYIKHIQGGDIYLGKHYDADEKWEIALKNYILNLKNILN